MTELITAIQRYAGWLYVVVKGSATAPSRATAWKSASAACINRCW